MPERRGMTIIELVVVLVIIAILATAASVSLRPYIQRQRISRAIEQLAAADQHGRTVAVRTRSPVSLKVTANPAGWRLRSLDSSGRDFAVPPSVRLGPIVVRPNSSGAPDGFGRTGGGVVLDSHGRSGTYGVPLSMGSMRRYAIIVGGSGQLYVTADVAEFRNWF